jgi:hypothetical protein
MSTTFVIVQTLFNLVLAFSVFFLLRERRPAALLAHARKTPRETATAAWESLDQRIPDVGRDSADELGGASAPVRPGARAPDTQAEPGDRLRLPHTTDTHSRHDPFVSPDRNPNAPENTTRASAWVDTIEEKGAACVDAQPPSPFAAEPTSRLRQAAQLLDLGCSPEEVANRVAIPQGEVQVLWNLRRAQALHAKADSPSVDTSPITPAGVQAHTEAFRRRPEMFRAPRGPARPSEKR